MAKKSKNNERAKNRSKQGKRLAKKDKAKTSMVIPGAGNWKENAILRPFVLIAQIIWIFLDVATLFLRMLVYTLIYDTPHGKHEMMLSSGSRGEPKS